MEGVEVGFDLLYHPFSFALIVFSIPLSLSSVSFELFVSVAARTEGKEKQPTNRIQQNIHIHIFNFCNVILKFSLHVPVLDTLILPLLLELRS